MGCPVHSAARPLWPRAIRLTTTPSSRSAGKYPICRESLLQSGLSPSSTSFPVGTCASVGCRVAGNQALGLGSPGTAATLLITHWRRPIGPRRGDDHSPSSPGRSMTITWPERRRFAPVRRTSTRSPGARAGHMLSPSTVTTAARRRSRTKSSGRRKPREAREGRPHQWGLPGRQGAGAAREARNRREQLNQLVPPNEQQCGHRSGPGGQRRAGQGRMPVG